MHQCTILHIEDDEADHELFRRDLAKLGFAGQYVRARSFEEAKQLLERGKVSEDKPDLIVADSKLGAYDGLDVIEWAKKNDRYRETPVVVYSTAIAPRQRAAMIQAGAAACLIKPIDSQETLVALELILSYVDKKCDRKK